MNYFIPLYVVLLSFLQSCSESTDTDVKYSPKEYLQSVVEDSVLIPGVGLGKLMLEKTRGEDLFNEKINGYSYSDLNIALSYREADTLIGITIMNDRNYRTPEGKIIGMNKSEIINQLGNPKSIGTPYRDTSFGVLPTLNYEGMSIWFGDSTRTIYLFKETRQ
jgi:hypothetical protein